jgi:methionyl aminopeptidase
MSAPAAAAASPEELARKRAVLMAMKELLDKDPAFKDLAPADQMKRASEYALAKAQEAAAISAATGGAGAAAAAAAADAAGGGASKSAAKKSAAADAAAALLQQYDRKAGPAKVAGTYADVGADRAVNPFPTAGKGKLQQTWPEPSVPVLKQFAREKFPEGLVCLHGQPEINAYRCTSEEKRALEREPLEQQRLYDLRQAAEVHRQVRTYVQSWIAPDMPLMTIATRLEKKLQELIGYDKQNPLKCGQAFPTGLSLNDCAAHDSVNTGDTRVLKQTDVLKIDFGAHVNGHIIDCAWSVHFDPRWDSLVEATKAATAEGIKQAGVDARLGEIGGCIEEVMTSFEVELGGKTYGVKPIANLSGHSILPYVIHGGKSVHLVKGNDNTRMEEGEQYAIETFGSIKGKGVIFEDNGAGGCSHYMLKQDSEMPHSPPRSSEAQQLLSVIKRWRGTLAFQRRWLDDLGQNRHALALKQLCDGGYCRPYPPLCDVAGSMTSQEEHTILLRPTCKEVLSRGLDY